MLGWQAQAMPKARLLFRSNLPVQIPYTCTTKARIHNKSKIGNREVVGFGFNGEYSYMDRTDFPFPAIRFRKSTPDVMALREKERGDWRKLSIEEKKCLYRISFRQTFAEINAPDGSGRAIVGWSLVFISIGLWVHRLIISTFDPAPSSFSPESRIAQYYRQVGINNQPISGNYRPPGAIDYSKSNIGGIEDKQNKD